jgi:hypothetical protein
MTTSNILQARTGRRHWSVVALVVLGTLIGALIWLIYWSTQQEQRNKALIAAIKHYDTQRVVALLKAGADPNTRDTIQPVSWWNRLRAKLSGKRAPFTGPTALQIVFDTARKMPDHARMLSNIPLRQEPVVMIRELLARGANVKVNYSDEADQPLIITPADMGWTESVQMLLDKGADCNARTRDGDTVLNAAIRSENARLVKLLIARGANVNTQDYRGVAPL